MASSTPNHTLYLNNLNDKVNKEELKTQLYALFSTYGKIISIVASKDKKLRGQAFLVFTDLAAATAALRACEGMVFYDKPLRINYAKTKSYATLKREDPNFIPPSTARPGPSGQKRGRDDLGDAGPDTKREKIDDDDEEEMDIDDEDEQEQPEEPFGPNIPSAAAQPTTRLLCTNLPQEVTNDVLSVLFQQYQGYKSTSVTQSPIPNKGGDKVKMARITFDSVESAMAAQKAQDNAQLKKGWFISVVFM